MRGVRFTCLLGSVATFAVVSGSAPAIAKVTDNAPGGASSSAAIAGKVVQVTARAVFVNLGNRHGLQVGDTVDISVSATTFRPGRAATFRAEVLSVWHSGARCELPSDAPIPKVGAQVVARPRKASSPHVSRVITLSRPATLEKLRSHWQGVSLRRQRLVVFDDEEEENELERDSNDRSTVRGMLALEYSEVVNPLDLVGEAYRQVALRSDLDVSGMLGGRLDYSHRMRVRYEIVPSANALRYPTSRNPLHVYRLQGSLNLPGVQANFGRTQAGPIADAGLIDGVSLRRDLSEEVAVGAWAGAAPRITDLRPSADSLAFGVYGSVNHALSDEHSRITLDGGLLGTTWAGSMDRKAFSVSGSLVSESSWIHALAVVEIGAQTRPTVDPSQLYIDVGTALTSKLHLSVRADQVRSVRTGEALALLPSRRFSTVAFSSLRAGLRYRVNRHLRLSTQSGWRLSAEDVGSLWTSASVSAVGVFLGTDRASFSVDGAAGSDIDGGSARIAYTLPVHRRLSLRARYRLYAYRYGFESERFYRHQPSVGIEGLLPWEMFGSMDVDAYLGAERMMLSTFVSIAKLF